MYCLLCNQYTPQTGCAHYEPDAVHKKEKTLFDIKPGDKFRFESDPIDRVRIACQVGKTEIYCPHQDSNPFDAENDVYHRNPKTKVIHIS